MGHKRLLKAILITCLMWGMTSGQWTHARGVYQTPEEFIQQAFEGAPPDAQVLWLTKSRRAVVEEVLAHPANQLRIRYWLKNGRSAWILEEIGKEKPITTGYIVENNKIQKVKVLIFRESRGWEVRHDFFTDQFSQAQLADNNQLDRHIDGISGATLSVRALTKLARLALYFHQQVTGS